ncbi:tRNA (adenosine(37)-N6)-dimethylallyltransferase MiaA [Deinococcus koreensis]|uniref:tRNA dimethylallyltransferase n=1 Tax=Deinococcus koreensis TaxID=2054903 RepID=A0A2K3V1V7_9DEIO|nr:tRNA (adenosine(37)-N6)-dimethylallyltransferase MiaA [Deinococcus koreensis]PNY82755.1 tRNA (adenosine(37)-N6)-dimethylallyltransferase MiaA [Deinococcus koreensis]
MPPVRRIPILTAPTAAGKSALALQVALERGQAAGLGAALEIVSADAFTVYRGLDIGTAKPTAAERAAVPHHLLDTVEVTQPSDVAQFVQAAETAIRDILNRGRTPLVVGGTGFYLGALLRGLPLTPPSEPARRAEVEWELQERGLDALLAEIAAADPAEAARMERNPRRVVRALELYRATGRLPGHYGRRPPAFGYDVTALTRPPEELGRRIGERTRTMLQAGWPGEAGWLAAQVDPETVPLPTVWQALGYREALAVQRGALDVAQAAERITLATRQYAKRQATFIRTQLGAPLLSPEEARERLLGLTALWRGT